MAPSQEPIAHLTAFVDGGGVVIVRQEGGAVPAGELFDDGGELFLHLLRVLGAEAELLGELDESPEQFGDLLGNRYVAVALQAGTDELALGQLLLQSVPVLLAEGLSLEAVGVELNVVRAVFLGRGL